MNIEEIGLTLKQIRKTYSPKLVFPDDVNPFRVQIKQRIEEGNCKTNSLLIYINALGLVLTINGQPVQTLEEFGRALAKIRQEAGITQLDIVIRTGLTHSRLSGIEKGYGSFKKTLITYLSALPPVNFDLIDKHGLYT